MGIIQRGPHSAATERSRARPGDFKVDALRIVLSSTDVES